ncbi:DUF4435 domain-containing protein [Providencia rettgeri]|uniref:DUF4435 domain-containing protein n=1 Tax=Providencia rettgeri TaxID=587 RepID=UPI000F4A7D88|nr:DUF4435 domain-containing protein [Providencia rettgeri]MBQ0606087.1 DUF4435 domain-containing protein [Providencia rettgeri]MCJ2222504.1 DUF4435 domain-containing protein [Providencia rettgeri]MCK8629736.1 DUF4435 domain-containing protein [Providencia rettgeri]MDY0822106.1 DUF4435 domain-containing protein [Providencia rettgeri]
MNDIAYSIEAENVLSLFFEADYIVYVEGIDDVCFWDVILNEFSDLKYEVIDVGGCHNLEPYIEKILNNSIKDLVALDSDFNLITGNRFNNKRILYTNGYSIENTYITAESIKKTIKHIGRFNSKTMFSLEIERWLESFINSMECLIKLDIHNHLYQRGEVVISDSVHLFLSSKDATIPDVNKVSEKKQLLIESLGYINDVEVDHLISPYPLYCLLKGHFIFSGVANYIRLSIKSFGKKASIPDDSIYSSLIANFVNIFNEEHPEYLYYKDIVEQSYS